MAEWPAQDHVATSWCLSGWPTPGRWLGTNYIYEHEVADRQGEKGFRWRPKYLAYMKARDDAGLRQPTSEADDG